MNTLNIKPLCNGEGVSNDRYPEDCTILQRGNLNHNIRGVGTSRQGCDLALRLWALEFQVFVLSFTCIESRYVYFNATPCIDQEVRAFASAGFRDLGSVLRRESFNICVSIKTLKE